MSKEKDIKQWLKESEGIEEKNGGDYNWLVGLINDCFNDLGLSNEWVSVDDRLPEENKTYLINVAGEGVFEAGFYRCPEYENIAWHCPVTHDDIDFTVTHWQPLPLPPKESGE